MTYDDFSRYVRPRLAKRFFPRRKWDGLSTEEKATVTAATDELWPLHRTAMEGARAGAVHAGEAT